MMVERRAVTIDALDTRVVRDRHLVERVVFVGGFGGCGKSLMTPIVGTFARVEIQKYNYALEHICSLSFLRKIDEEVATTMIRMLTDMDLYNVMMSREVNLRFSDMSSIFRNPGTLRYLRRLFQPGDAVALERIKTERPILQILMHHLLALSPPLFKALGERVRIIEVVRHPLYMIKQLHREVERTDPRMFTICFECLGRPVPFFARGWEEQYFRSGAMDKAIHYLDHLSRMNDEVLQKLSEEERDRVRVVPFERFVLDPQPYLEAFERLLTTQMLPATRRELKRQKVPRKIVAAGLDVPIYRKYGWEPPEEGGSEISELARRRRYAEEHASAEGLDVLDRLCAAYEETYLPNTGIGLFRAGRNGQVGQG